MTQIIDPRDELMSALATLHLGGRYSDLTIVGATRRWAVHKVVVCSRSGFFNAACGGPFKEASTNRIVLDEDDETALDHMIHYFYHLDYLNTQQAELSLLFPYRRRTIVETRRTALDLSKVEDPLMCQVTAIQASQAAAAVNSVVPDSHQHKRSRSLVEQHLVSSTIRSIADNDSTHNKPAVLQPTHLVLHARVYALADNYDVPGLKTLAKMKFATAMTKCRASAEMADAFDEVYNSTADCDRGLRDIVIQAMRIQPHLTGNEDILDVIEQTPTLAFELWRIERGYPV